MAIFQSIGVDSIKQTILLEKIPKYFNMLIFQDYVQSVKHGEETIEK